MPFKNQRNHDLNQISRREFLKITQLLIGGTAFGSLGFLAACSKPSLSTSFSTKPPTTSANTTTTPTPTYTTEHTNAPTTATTSTVTSVVADETLSEILEKSANMATLKYDQITTAGGSQTAQTIYVKKHFMRVETVSEGFNLIVLVNHNTSRLYNWWPDEKFATRGKMEEARISAPMQASSCLDFDPNVVAADTIDGKECLKLDYTANGLSNTMWIWKQYGLPLRWEGTSEGGNSLVEYRNYDFSDLSDGIFQLPDDKCDLCKNGDLCD